MSEVIRLGVNDFEDALDFMDFVFSKNSNPHDFETRLPKVYRKTEEMMRCIYAIREDGKFVSAAGSFIEELKIGDKTFLHSGIGAVCTHPRKRGGGHMTRVMEKIIEDMRAQGVALSALGGQRNRYGHFGYERGGFLCSINLTKKNISLSFPEYAGGDYTFERITPGSKLEEKARAMNLARVCRFTRKYFAESLMSNGACGFAALKNGEFAGYYMVDGSGTSVSELVAPSAEEVLAIARAYVYSLPANGATFCFPLYEACNLACLTGHAESVSIAGGGNFLILDWAGVTEAYMRLKSSYSPLADGSITLGIEGWGSLTIDVSGGVARCEKTQRQPDIMLDRLRAVRLIYSQSSFIEAAALPEKARALCVSWFPLPICRPSPDAV